MARTAVVALLLAGIVSAQNLISSAFLASTTVPATATRFGSSSTITVGPNETTIRVFAGGEWTAGLTGSIISINECATTYAFHCTDTSKCTATDFTATLTQGPSSWGGVIETTYGRTSLVGTESCAISGSSRAVCVATATVVVGTSTVIVGTTSTTRATYFGLPIPASVSIPTGTCTLPQSVQYAPAATTGTLGYTSIYSSGTGGGMAATTALTTRTTTNGNSVGIIVETPGATTSTSTRTGAAPAITAFVKNVMPAAMAVVALV